jgi:hypothetical protein
MIAKISTRKETIPIVFGLYLFKIDTVAISSSFRCCSANDTQKTKTFAHRNGQFNRSTDIMGKEAV